MAEAAPYAEGQAGPFGNPQESWANYLNNYLIYKAMGLSPDPRGGGLSVPMPGTNPSAEALVAESNIPTIPSRAIGTGLGTGPVDIAGTSAVAGLAGIPTIPSRQIGSGLGYPPTDISGALRDLPGLVWDGTKWVVRAAKDALTGEGGIPSWLGDVLKAMAGIGTSVAALGAQKGLSEEEKAFQAQAARLLKQQEQRTQFQNPLYAYITQQAYGLQPGPDKRAYPYNSLDDVQVP